jgi:hypothetical protein
MSTMAAWVCYTSLYKALTQTMGVWGVMMSRSSCDTGVMFQTTVVAELYIHMMVMSLAAGDSGPAHFLL